MCAFFVLVGNFHPGDIERNVVCPDHQHLKIEFEVHQMLNLMVKIKPIT